MPEEKSEKIQPFFALQYTVVPETVVREVPAVIFVSTDFSSKQGFPPDYISVLIRNNDVFHGSATYKLTWKGSSEKKVDKYTYISAFKLSTANVTIPKQGI